MHADPMPARPGDDQELESTGVGFRPGGSVPRVLTRDAVRRVDSTAIAEYGIPGVVLMENAARAVATEALALARASGRAGVTVWCGPGNNGGDGYAAARHLHNAGLDVRLVPVGTSRDGSDAELNRRICVRMGLAMRRAEEIDPMDATAVVVDALLGTGLDRPPTGELRSGLEAIVVAHAAGAPVLAVDVPSGLDADTGQPLELAVSADVTVTFVAAKPGLLAASAARHVGRLVVADIGVPRELVARLATLPPARRGDDAGDRSTRRVR